MKILSRLCKFFSRRFDVVEMNHINKEITLQKDKLRWMLRKIIEGDGTIGDIDFMRIELESARLRHLQDTMKRFEKLASCSCDTIGIGKKRYVAFSVFDGYPTGENNEREE